MRILALTTLYPNPYQPHRAMFNRQQFRALAAEHQVQIIAPISWTGEWAGRRRNDEGLFAGNRTRLFDGMVVHHPRFVFTPKLMRRWHGRFLLESVRSCFRAAVREFRPDVVLGCWAYPDGWAAVPLAREENLPVAIKVHGSDLLTLENQPARKKLTIEALTSADAVIAVSRHLMTCAGEMGVAPAKLRLVYNGVDTSLFRPGPRDAARRQLGLDSADPLIVFVGNLVPVKGIDVLLSSLALLSRSERRFQCVLIGDGPLKAELQTRADSLRLGSQVRFIGPRPLEQLPLWYQSANLVVLPSRSEGVPNVLLEATACGIPFVACRVGGIPEIAPADALVPAGDCVALAERIGSFLNRPHSSAGDASFTVGSWSDSARALADVLQGVVKANASPAKRAG